MLNVPITNVPTTTFLADAGRLQRNQAFRKKFLLNTYVLTDQTLVAEPAVGATLETELQAILTLNPTFTVDYMANA